MSMFSMVQPLKTERMPQTDLSDKMKSFRRIASKHAEGTRPLLRNVQLMEKAKYVSVLRDEWKRGTEKPQVNAQKKQRDDFRMLLASTSTTPLYLFRKCISHLSTVKCTKDDYRNVKCIYLFILDLYPTLFPLNGKLNITPKLKAQPGFC